MDTTPEGAGIGSLCPLFRDRPGWDLTTCALGALFLLMPFRMDQRECASYVERFRAVIPDKLAILMEIGGGNPFSESPAAEERRVAFQAQLREIVPRDVDRLPPAFPSARSRRGPRRRRSVGEVRNGFRKTFPHLPVPSRPSSREVLEVLTSLGLANRDGTRRKPRYGYARRGFPTPADMIAVVEATFPEARLALLT